MILKNGSCQGSSRRGTHNNDDRKKAKEELTHTMPTPDDVFRGQDIDSESMSQSHVDNLATYIQQLHNSVGFYEGQLARQKSIESRLPYLSFQTRLREWVDNFLGWRWAGVLVSACATGAVFFVATLSWTVTVVGVVIGGVGSLFILYFPTDSDVASENDELIRLQAANLANTEVLTRQRASLADLPPFSVPGVMRVLVG